MDAKNAALGLLVGEGELDLSVDTSGANEGGVEGLDAVSGHDDLDIAAVVETIEASEELKHRALDFALATGRGVVTAAEREQGQTHDGKPAQLTAWYQSRQSHQ